MARRAILVGEDNPYGSDPYFALYPSPEGCAGWRLCCRILGMHRTSYLHAFQRVNLCLDRWSAREAKDAADAIFCGSDHKIVALGSKVAGAFGLKFRPYECDGKRILMLPHPSGRCRLWGEPGAVERARRAVCAFLPHHTRLIGEIFR